VGLGISRALIRCHHVSRFSVVMAAEWETWVAENDGVILDVRQPNEWELGTLPGALRISMGELPDRIGELPRERPILVVCRSGSRSHQVAAYLSKTGFTGAANMVGGMKALGLQD
jgi:rhodanese-related sulfurtransferase